MYHVELAAKRLQGSEREYHLKWSEGIDRRVILNVKRLRQSKGKRQLRQSKRAGAPAEYCLHAGRDCTWISGLA